MDFLQTFPLFAYCFYSDPFEHSENRREKTAVRISALAKNSRQEPISWNDENFQRKGIAID
jgi:hypothetical protein